MGTMKLKVSMKMPVLKICLHLKVMLKMHLVWKKLIKKNVCSNFTNFFSFLPQANIRRKKVNNKPSFYKRDLIQIVCLFQPKIYFICNTHLLCNFFSSLICVNFTKKIIRKKNIPFKPKKKKKKKKKK